MDAGFYFAGGLGSLIALISWGDQIRGAQETTRTLEREFLLRHKLKWSDLQPLVRRGDSNPTKRLRAVLGILRDGGLKKSGDIGILKQLEDLNAVRLRLEFRYAVRYWAVFGLAVHMFLSGVLLTFAPDWHCAPTIAGATFAVLVSIGLFTTFILARDEGRLRSGLAGFDDLMRLRDEQGESEN